MSRAPLVLCLCSHIVLGLGIERSDCQSRVLRAWNESAANRGASAVVVLVAVCMFLVCYGTSSNVARRHTEHLLILERSTCASDGHMPPAEPAAATSDAEVAVALSDAEAVSADPSPAIPCVPIDHRTDGAPGWCNDFPEATCHEFYIVNVHKVPRPCVWLDVGCRASNAEACGHEALPMGSADAGRGNGWTLAIVFILLIVVALHYAASLLKGKRLVLMGMDLSETMNKVRKARRSKAAAAATRQSSEGEDEEEVGELLHNGEEGDGDASLEAASAMSAEATREAAVACATARALLEAQSAEMPSDGAIGTSDEPAHDAPLSASALDEAHGSAKDDQQGVEEGIAKVGASPRLRNEPELPALSLCKSHAIFDTGDLFDNMGGAAGPHASSAGADGTAVPDDVQGMATAVDDEKEEQEQEDEEFCARPSDSSQWLHTKKNLAMSLD